MNTDAAAKRENPADAGSRASPNARKPGSGSIWIAWLCRAGFEDDLIEEVSAWIQDRGSVTALLREPGMLLLELTSRPGAHLAAPAYADLVFARDQMQVAVQLSDLDTRDRFGPIEKQLDALGPLISVTVLAADSDAGKPLAPLVRALQARVGARANPSARTAAYVWLVSGTQALIGTQLPGAGAIYPGGIARLRFPREAPSRSTLKLDEAFCVLLTQAERDRLLKAGMRAVDLGAAPGGWTYQLVRRHMRVFAVDNGRMDAQLLQSGLVDHLREDGFRYLPARPVDWLVCDMVEKPAKVVDLVLKWFKGGHCRAAVFNLKLPMKKRFEAWAKARAALESLAACGHMLRARQLYHDREEITVALIPSASVKPGRTKPPQMKVVNAASGRVGRQRS